MQKKITQWIYGSVALTCLALTGCMQKPVANQHDPLEKMNRVIFAFNMDVDHLAFGPIAKVYDFVIPTPLKKGISNIFSTLDVIPTFPNDFLQGNFRYMVVDIWRFTINATLGIGGLFDVATCLGIPKHVETFGLTLAKWRGGKSAPYFVIPFLGPSTFQSAVGVGVDYYLTPWPYLRDQNIGYWVHGVRLVHTRAKILPSDKLINTAFDPYAFVRDAFIQTEDRLIKENQALPKIPPVKAVN